MGKIASALVLALALAGCAAPDGGAAPRPGGMRPYPFDTCLVTGTRLGSMGDPHVKVYGDREIKFCCEPCVEEFEADPERFLGMLPK